jgi:hypothetical protein
MAAAKWLPTRFSFHHIFSPISMLPSWHSREPKELRRKKRRLKERPTKQAATMIALPLNVVLLGILTYSALVGQTLATLAATG